LVPPIHHRFAELEHIGRHRHHLGRADRTEERDDVRLRGQLRKRQHDARIGGLVVFDNQLDLLAEYAAGLVDRRERKLGAVLRPKTLLGSRSRNRHAHADLDGRSLRPRAADNVGGGNTNGQTSRKIASR